MKFIIVNILILLFFLPTFAGNSKITKFDNTTKKQKYYLNVMISNDGKITFMDGTYFVDRRVVRKIKKCKISEKYKIIVLDSKNLIKDQISCDLERMDGYLDSSTSSESVILSGLYLDLFFDYSPDMKKVQLYEDGKLIDESDIVSHNDLSKSQKDSQKRYELRKKSSK